MDKFINEVNGLIVEEFFVDFLLEYFDEELFVKAIPVKMSLLFKYSLDASMTMNTIFMPFLICIELGTPHLID